MKLSQEMSRNKLGPMWLVSMVSSRTDVTMHPLTVLLVCEWYKGDVDALQE